MKTNQSKPGPIKSCYLNQFADTPALTIMNVEVEVWRVGVRLYRKYSQVVVNQIEKDIAALCGRPHFESKKVFCHYCGVILGGRRRQLDNGEYTCYLWCGSDRFSDAYYDCDKEMKRITAEYLRACEEHNVFDTTNNIDHDGAREVGRRMDL